MDRPQYNRDLQVRPVGDEDLEPARLLAGRARALKRGDRHG